MAGAYRPFGQTGPSRSPYSWQNPSAIAPPTAGTDQGGQVPFGPNMQMPQPHGPMGGSWPPPSPVGLGGAPPPGLGGPMPPGAMGAGPPDLGQGQMPTGALPAGAPGGDQGGDPRQMLLRAMLQRQMGQGQQAQNPNPWGSMMGAGADVLNKIAMARLFGGGGGGGGNGSPGAY